MGEQTAIRRDGTWLTPLAGLCLGLALVAAAVLLTAALGYRTSALGLGAAFDLLRWGAYGGATAASVSLLAILLIAVRGVGAGRLAVASLALVIGGVSYWLPAEQRNTAFASPPIHDITTDTDDPPLFVAVVPLRADAPNSPEYDPSVASQQKDAYPDLVSIPLDVPPAEAFDRALSAAESMGWEMVAADQDAGRIEATDTTFWFGFKDDVVVRIRPSDGGSRVDVRSKSRVGGGDVGANAARIRAYRQQLTGG